MKKYILTLLLAALAFIANAQLLDQTPYTTRTIVDDFFKTSNNTDSVMMNMLDYVASYASQNDIIYKIGFITTDGVLIIYEHFKSDFVEDPYEGTYK